MFLNLKVKEELEAKGMRMSDLSKKVPYSQSFFSQVFAMKKKLPEDSAIKILSKGLGYKLDKAKELIAKWKIEEYAEDVSNLDELMYELGATKLNLGEDFINLPIYGSIPCGTAGDTDVIDTAAVPVKGLDKSREYYILRANGLSMSPEIPHGSEVVIERTKEYRGPSKIYVFKIGSDELGLGRLVQADGRWEISKSNKDYPPIPVQGAHSLEICGVAVRKIENL